eukprot:10266643-Alexandrium_andersonii.AAC.1
MDRYGMHKGKGIEGMTRVACHAEAVELHLDACNLLQALREATDHTPSTGCPMAGGLGAPATW